MVLLGAWAGKEEAEEREKGWGREEGKEEKRTCFRAMTEGTG